MSEDTFRSEFMGATPVAIEFVKGAPSLFEFEHPKHAYYIFGPEDGSLPKRLQKNVVYIPTTYCLNLAATVNIVLYDRAAKLGRVQ